MGLLNKIRSEIKSAVNVNQPPPPPAMNAPKVCVGYYTSWSIYARKFLPSQVPADCLTHVLYSFADVRPETGEVFLVDAWADEQIRHPGDRPDDGTEAAGANLHGNLLGLARLKRSHRHLKLLLSVGGWTLSSHFAPAARDASRRATFAASCARLVEDYGLDGIDVDWEYPRDAQEAGDYVELLRATRSALDELGRSKGETTPEARYLLTVAAPATGENLEKMRLEEMDGLLDFWNVMTYDFSGSWAPAAGHHAQMRGAGASCESAVESFVRRGVASTKLVLGLPLYGRSFLNCPRGAGGSYSGVGKGSWEEGNYDYKALPLPNTAEQTDLELGASWCHDTSPQGGNEWVTYETPATACHKVRRLVHHARSPLRGAMFWELSGDDYEREGRSVVRAVARELGELDRSPNHVAYPRSRFANLRSGEV